ncbi:hypothetical protein GT347_15980 [Xylophilus rhododendri]|uniref:HTH cro/C1-type domain-containing protein n=1 Tax=Xylophilus rhododendri TaxID=2697032 RepID=A0A857J7Y8_9BURK|nr:helix-turn-helix transcriptional regulator [Xylophilus rhododendri]QHI99343.1 hypothetical protein GT347_15980 [Xylophilus rhododendri]
MDGHFLLKLLLDAEGLNPNSLAAKAEGVHQPTIAKYLNKQVREPRRTSMAPVAKFFGIPVEAFYDPDVADWVASNMNKEARKAGDHRVLWRVADRTPAVPAPTPLNPPTRGVRELVLELRALLEPQPAGIRSSVAAILKDVAEKADDAGFAESMAERIIGALGLPGKDVPQRSTPSKSKGME